MRNDQQVSFRIFFTTNHQTFHKDDYIVVKYAQVSKSGQPKSKKGAVQFFKPSVPPHVPDDNTDTLIFGQLKRNDKGVYEIDWGKNTRSMVAPPSKAPTRSQTPASQKASVYHATTPSVRSAKALTPDEAALMQATLNNVAVRDRSVQPGPSLFPPMIDAHVTPESFIPEMRDAAVEAISEGSAFMNLQVPSENSVARLESQEASKSHSEDHASVIHTPNTPLPTEKLPSVASGTSNLAPPTTDSSHPTSIPYEATPDGGIVAVDGSGNELRIKVPEQTEEELQASIDHLAELRAAPARASNSPSAAPDQSEPSVDPNYQWDDQAFSSDYVQIASKTDVENELGRAESELEYIRAQIGDSSAPTHTPTPDDLESSEPSTHIDNPNDPDYKPNGDTDEIDPDATDSNPPTEHSQTDRPQPEPPGNTIQPEPPSHDPNATPDGSTVDGQVDIIVRPEKPPKPKEAVASQFQRFLQLTPKQVSRFAQVYTARDSSDSTFDTDDFISDQQQQSGTDTGTDTTPDTEPNQTPDDNAEQPDNGEEQAEEENNELEDGYTDEDRVPPPTDETLPPEYNEQFPAPAPPDNQPPHDATPAPGPAPVPPPEDEEEDDQQQAQRPVVSNFSHTRPFPNHFQPGYDVVTGDLVWKVGFGFNGSFDTFFDYVRFLTNNICKRVQEEIAARPGGNGQRIKVDNSEIIDSIALHAQKRLYFRSNPGYVYCYWGHSSPNMLRLLQSP
ncbi:Hypothetical protein GLP15_4363 [Giardia lamblia P15]|uniref:Uncharacterized protein n=1 Tax=Giardia intestinalis (strain P15) TaxID=658858 RepID=E1F7F1_GIAIA|nr:Hypothetical protein GLP15_4363 [Giardia lamblia P15]